MSYIKEKKTKKVVLPSDSNYWVEILDGIEWEKGKLLINSDASVNPEYAEKIFEIFITDWNLDDEQGNKLPITKESFGRLALNDVAFLTEEISKTIVPIIEKKTTNE